MNVIARPHVWITGASSGLGAALAVAYTNRGHDVAITARTIEQLEQVAESTQEPCRISVHPADVTRPEEITQAVAKIEQRRPIDIAILNAGTYRQLPFERWTPEAFDELFRINVHGVLNCLNAVVPAMQARRAGTLGIVASVAADIGLPYAGPYSATKASLNRLCQSLRPELAAHGIHTSVINPGFVKTPLTDKNDFPMPFLIEAEDAAEIIYRGLDKRRMNIRFPWQMSLLMRLLGSLPAPLQLKITQRMLRQ